MLHKNRNLHGVLTDGRIAGKLGRTVLWALALLLMGLPACSSVEQTHPAGRAAREYVILLHGMGRTRASMLKLEQHLLQKGFRTLNIDYPSTRQSVAQTAETQLADAVAQCARQGAERIHLVTHSLGGIIVRRYLQNHRLPHGSRLVMLSPPNQGSEVADMMKAFFGYRWAFGPAGQQLGTAAGSLPNTLKPVGLEVGVITGDKSLDPWFSELIPGADDGKVAVERAKLNEMTDFRVVARSHALIMRDPEVLHQVVHFLDSGKFDTPESASKPTD